MMNVLKIEERYSFPHISLKVSMLIPESYIKLGTLGQSGQRLHIIIGLVGFHNQW